MTYALPEYLVRDDGFKDCPPGHCFGLYFAGWGQDWSLQSTKAQAYGAVTANLPEHSRKALLALGVRQDLLADQLNGSVLKYPARLASPLATGLGNEHPLENGFAFLNPHGLPYLAGSGVKGVLRRAARELSRPDWGSVSGWDDVKIDILFGTDVDRDEMGSSATRGALCFWDLYFQPLANKNVLTVEIMTPHHAGYLQGAGTPHANEQPVPIPFLAVPAGCACTLYVQCYPAMIPEDFIDLRENWKVLVDEAIEHAGQWLGFGAKKSVGYGRIEIDPKAQAQRDAQLEAEQAAKRQRDEAAALAVMPPDKQLMSLLKKQLANLPMDPKTQKVIFQKSSGQYWRPLMDLLEGHVQRLASLDKSARENLAVEIKKLVNSHFRIEGKAESSMKKQLSAIRGQ